MPRGLSDAEKWQALERGHGRAVAYARANGVDLATAARAVAAGGRHTAAERELLTYAATLTPQHIAYLQQLERVGGPEMVIDALARVPGLSREAVEVAAATITEAGGLQGAAERVQGRLAEARQSSEEAGIAASVQRHTLARGDAGMAAAIKQHSPAAAALRDAEEQRRWAQFFREKGWAPEPGRTPMETGLRMLAQLEDGRGGLLANSTRQLREPKMTADEQIEALAQVMGESVATVRYMAEGARDLAVRDGLARRMATRDVKAAAQRKAAGAKPAAQVARNAEVARQARTVERGREQSRRDSLRLGIEREEAREAVRSAPAKDGGSKRVHSPRSQPGGEERQHPNTSRREALSAAIDAAERESAVATDTSTNTPETGAEGGDHASDAV